MVYLDYNATTPLCDAAREAMLPFLQENFGNPSSVHAAGREARAGIDTARNTLADLLATEPHELIFTSGGTESNNLAVLGLARAASRRGKHLISCRTEHHAVLNALEYLEKHEGFEVTWIGVSPTGIIDLDQFADAIRQDTILASVMHANNETGVIQPLEEISRICRSCGVLLHSDMVQSFGKIPAVSPTAEEESHSPTSADLGRRRSPSRRNWDKTSTLSLVDAASFAAHKFYGPKGAGLLFLRSGIPIRSIHFGGAHENQRRPGTENVADIIGMAAAAEWAITGLRQEQDRERELRDQLWSEISREVPSAILNGDVKHRLANTLNISVPEVDSETMLIALDVEGVCASSGSACMVGSVVASHVLLAMGSPLEIARSAIRFSLGKFTAPEEISLAASMVSKIVHRGNGRHVAKTDRFAVQPA